MTPLSPLGNERRFLTHCPVCLHEHFTYQFTHAALPIVRCDGCTLLMRNPQPADADLESHGGRGFSPGDHAGPEGPASVLQLLDRVERYLGWDEAGRQGRLLIELDGTVEDVLREASRRGYRTAGPGDSVGHVCVLSGAIEHARDPMLVLDGVWRALTPGGALVVRTPSLDGLAASRLRDYWNDFPANPLFFFDRSTLESALVRAGFEDVRISRGPGNEIDVVARRGRALPIDRRRPRVSVVMPVFNEKDTFSEVIGQLLRKEMPDVDLEIVIVESRSTDGTSEDVRAIEHHPRVKVIWQDRARGKGHAVREGLSQVTGDFVLIQDADLEYDLDDYEMLLEPLRTFRQAFVLGVRHGRDGHTWKVRHFTGQVLLGQWMNLGHRIFTALFNVVYGQRLRDPFTMFKVFRRECLSGLHFECNKFDFDWELTGKLVRCGYEPLEIPVNYTSRSFAEGKKVTMVRDPLTWVRACIKYRFTRLKDESV